MKILIYTLPMALLVAYSQLIVKWRSSIIVFPDTVSSSLLQKLIAYLSDPFIVSGYITALLSSFIWLLVLAKLPLSIAFPIYIGLTFLLVVLGSIVFINEPISTMKIASILLILLGIFVGSNA